MAPHYQRRPHRGRTGQIRSQLARLPFAGDDAQAKAQRLSVHREPRAESAGCRWPGDGAVGWRGAALLVVGLARNGVANYDFTLGVSLA